MNPYIKDKYDSKKFIDATGKDLVRCKGGDGTLLKAINAFRHLHKPFFGIAAGSENFLMNTEDSIVTGSKYKKFRLLRVKVTSKRHFINTYQTVTEEFQAFNDVIIGGNSNSWSHFDVHDKDRIIGKFKGGGIIFSTAQGSTGINKNNGGVILPLSSKNWVVTGDKTNRPINYVIEPSRTSITCTGRQPVTVWIDGANHVINDVAKIEISKGDVVTVIFNNYNDFKSKRKI